MFLLPLLPAMPSGLDHEMVNLSVLEKRTAGRDLVVIGGGAARLGAGDPHGCALSAHA